LPRYKAEGKIFERLVDEKRRSRNPSAAVRVDKREKKQRTLEPRRSNVQRVRFTPQGASFPFPFFIILNSMRNIKKNFNSFSKKVKFVKRQPTLIAK